MRIEIAGALSCGKSTLAGMLEKAGVKIVREDLSTNPYLDLRVEDPEKYDFPCQRQFVLDKIASLAKAELEGTPYVCDFSIAAERAYVSHYSERRADWLDPLFALLDRSEAEMGLPDLVVYLRCSPLEQLNRIRLRGREFEQGHDLSFVSGINDLVDTHVGNLRGRDVEVVEYWTDAMTWSDILSDLTAAHLERRGFRASETQPA
ncbi:deoxynucleoside kinase [Agrobacterium rubi]|nr:deoxynucleoside kinase [Agrobacterium rubi]NTF24190.1 deoxynucleoside kinase [Agrobacterium rubi]